MSVHRLQESLSPSFQGPLLVTNILAKRIQSELAGDAQTSRDTAFKENGLAEVVLGHSLNRWDYRELVDPCLAGGGARCADVCLLRRGVLAFPAPLETSPKREAPVHLGFQPLPRRVLPLYPGQSVRPGHRPSQHCVASEMGRHDTSRKRKAVEVPAVPLCEGEVAGGYAPGEDTEVCCWLASGKQTASGFSYQQAWRAGAGQIQGCTLDAAPGWVLTGSGENVAPGTAA